MTDWDTSVDLLIAGSGGGGMVAALATLDAGLEPLIVEKQALVGGSTGMSGGMVWLPNNPLMRRDGIADSHEDGLAYLADVVGDIGAPSTPARREVFLTAGSEMITFLLRKGVRLVRCPGWSDYYPNHKGGNAAGRGVEGIPFDAAELGDWSDKVQPSMAKNFGFVVLTNELRSVQYFNRAPRAFAVAMRVFLRTWAARIRRREVLTNGASLIAQMLKALIDLGDGGPPVWTNAAMEDLIVEDGRVVGARIKRDGATLFIEARKGVLLAAGGFGHNADMRRRYSGDQPNEGKWSIANAGDTGEVLARKPTSWTRLGGCHRFSSPTAETPPSRSARGGSDREQSTSTRPAGGFATSRTPTSRSARRCTPTRRCRAGWFSTRVTSAGMFRAPTR